MAFRSLMSIITAVSLTSGLKHCSDAGSSSSYSGSGNNLNDLSGNSTGFFLGATSGSEASDPTFAGSADGLTYGDRFTLDGGDWFRLGQTNPAWVNHMHQNNALFTALLVFKYKNSGSVQRLLGTAGTTSVNIGITLYTQTGNFKFAVGASGVNSLVAIVGPALPAADGYVVLAVSVDEAAGGSASFIFANGSVVTFNGTYTSPSAGSANSTLEMMAPGAGANPASSGSEFFAGAFWEGVALTQANITAIFNEIGLRLGIAPTPRLFQPIDAGVVAGIPSIEHGAV